MAGQSLNCSIAGFRNSDNTFMAAGFSHQTFYGSMWISKTYILAFSNQGMALVAETGVITNVVAEWLAAGVATTAAAVRAGGHPGPGARWWWWWRYI